MIWVGAAVCWLLVLIVSLGFCQAAARGDRQGRR